MAWAWPVRWLAAAFALGVALAGTSGADRAAVAAVAFWAALEAWPRGSGHRGRERRWLVAGLALTITAGWLSAGARLAPGAVVELSAPTPGAVTGVVVRAPEPRPGGAVLVLRGDGQKPGGGLVRVQVRAAPGRAEPLPWTLGDRLEVRGALRPPRPATNPGGWDFAAYLRRHGVGAVLTARPEDVRPAPSPGPGIGLRMARAALALRYAVERVHRETMPPGAAAVLGGMLFGATAELPEDVAEAYRTTGAYHVLAVSGSNVAFVVLAVAWALRAAGVPPLLNGLLGLGIIAAYAVMTGGGPSVGRASWMAALALGAVLVRRRRDAWTGLAAAALILLALDPGALFDAGFQLTFAASAALLALARPADRRLAALAPRLWRPVRQVLSATAVAQLGVAPLIAWHFGVMPLLGLLSNPVIVPAAGLLVVTGGAAGLAGLVWPPAAQALGWLNTAVVEVTTAWIRWLATLPGAAAAVAPWPMPAVVGWCAGLAFLAALGAASPGVPFTPWARRARLVALACAAWVAAGWAWGAWAPRPLEVVFFDVGQGDAALIRSPSGRAVLVDAGPPGAGRAVIVPYLRHAGIRRLDAVIVSHPHADHAAGAPEVAAAAVVGLLVEPAVTPTPADALGGAFPRTRRWTAAAGDRWALGGGVTLEVWWPPDRDGGYPGSGAAPDGAPAPAGPGYPPDKGVGEDSWVNNRSVVVRVRMGDVAILFTGDLEVAGEAGLLELAGGDLRAAVLKVSHHGSGSSTGPEFLAAVLPWAAVVSVGPNRYGHPHPAVLERLEAAGAEVWRTDREGAVMLRSDGRRITLRGYWSGRTAAWEAPAPGVPALGGSGGYPVGQGGPAAGRMAPAEAIFPAPGRL